MSRGMDGRCPPIGAGGGGGRSSGSGGRPPGVGGKGGLLLFGGGGGGGEEALGLEEPPGGGGRGPCRPGGRLGGGGPDEGLDLGPAGRDGGCGPPRGLKFWLGRGVLGMGGGAPPGVSCLEERFVRFLGRSGTPPRTTDGPPGSLGGPVTWPPPKGLGLPPKRLGGSAGPLLGPESNGVSESLTQYIKQLFYHVSLV